jgi:hypothetical protein
LKVVIEVECTGAAFDENPIGELKRILRTVPAKVVNQLTREAGCVCVAPEADDKLLDVNGNTVGSLRLTDVTENDLMAQDEPD